MRHLVYYVAVSLDGFIADPDGGFGAFDSTGDHMSTLVSEYADTLPQPARDALGINSAPTLFDTVVMGSRTYDVGASVGLVSPYPHLRQVVVTRSARTAPPEVELTDDPLAAVQALKSKDGKPIWLCGGGHLAAVLADEIDELILKVNPILLGDGIRLFGTRPAGVTSFTLMRSRSYDSGVMINEYVRR